MARKPNYRFERHERERIKAAKKAARAEAKAAKKAKPEDGETGEGTADEAGAPAVTSENSRPGARRRIATTAEASITVDFADRAPRRSA